MSDAPGSESGFVYVATGASYLKEAAESAQTLRQYHPTARICLITDQVGGEKFWDDIVTLEQPAFGFRDKLAMYRAPYSRCVFLDTDTRVCGDLSAVFTILSRYDICGVQISEGQDYEMPGNIPAAFPEMNGGMIAFRRSAATERFFQLWTQYYDEFQALNRDGSYHYANVGDQKSLRAALWHSEVRHACVGAEFNFIPFRLELASLPVAVLHTRATENLPTLAARLNASLGRRVYVPSLDVVLADALQPAEARKLVSASLKLLVRSLGRSCTPRAVRDWLRSQSRLSGWLFGNRYTGPHTGHDQKWKTPPAKS
jgi:hypothetical protein